MKQKKVEKAEKSRRCEVRTHLTQKRSKLTRSLTCLIEIGAPIVSREEGKKPPIAK